MKVLLLSSNIDAEHKILTLFKRHGVCPLVPTSPEEAWQTLQLHGSSVDIAIIQREGQGGNGESGFELIQKFKTDTEQSDLPYVLITEKWKDAECAAHQATPFGANGYLKIPFEEAQLKSMLEAILGEPLGHEVKPMPEQSLSLPALPPDPSDVSIETNVSSSNLGAEKTGPITPEPDEGLSVQHTPLPEGGQPDLEPTTSVVVDLQTSSQVLAQNNGDLSTSAFDLNRDSEIDALSQAPRPPTPEEMTMRIDLAGNLTNPAQPQVPAAALIAEIALPGAKLEKHEPAHAPIGQATEPVPATPTENADVQAAQQMPYLFSKMTESKGSSERSPDPFAIFSQPVGDAVVPGGAAQSPDLETMRKYLLLREQDVATLSVQLRSVRERLQNVEEELQLERAHNKELEHVNSQHQKCIDGFEQEKALAVEAVQAEVMELQFQNKAKNDKVHVLEKKFIAATEEIDQIKKRVRSDIQKIRIREKELENRLEILRKDSEALIGTRENKIIELKRKVDLLEFNSDLLQEQLAREKDLNRQLRERLAKVAQAMKVAGGLLGPEEAGGSGTQANLMNERKAV